MSINLNVARAETCLYIRPACAGVTADRFSVNIESPNSGSLNLDNLRKGLRSNFYLL